MKLLNLEDLTIFGAGSEWFWTMLTMVALTVTVLAIGRQLRVQRAANAFEQFQELEREWVSPRMRHIKLRLALGLRYGGDQPIEEFTGAVDAFFRKLEFLYRNGYLDLELLWLNFGEDVVRWWTVLADTVEKVRVAYDSPGEYAEFERLMRLMRLMRDMMLKRGVPSFETDADSIRGRLDWIIDGQTNVLRFEQELRDGVIPTPPPAPAAA